MHIRKRLIRFLTYLPVMVVYCAFFWVENTYNFDLISSSTSLFRKGYTTGIEQSSGNASGHYTCATPKKAGDHKPRLNKRFHPQDIIVTPFVTAELPVIHYIIRAHAGYQASPYDYTLVHLPQHRGPPAMV